MDFRKAGEHVIEVHGRVLLRRIIGPWNMERFRDYSSEVEAFIADLNADGVRPWATVVNFSRWDLGTFDIFSKYFSDHMEAYRADMAAGLAAECWVVSDAFTLTLLEHYVKIPPELPHRICETEEEALAWLAELGFSAAGYSSETQDS